MAKFIFSLSIADNELMNTILKQNQKGQAVLEYTLVLLVVLAIAQAVLQLNVAFRDWAEEYYISYIRCLLETGEVPTLGGTQEAGICNEEYSPFTWAGGRSPLGGGSGGSSADGGGGDGSSSSSSASGSSKAGKGNKKKGRGNERSSAGGGGGGRTSRFADNRQVNTRAGGSNSGENKGGEDSEEAGGFVQVNTRGGSGRQEGRQDRDGRGLFGSVEEEKKKRGKERTAVTSVDESSQAVRNKRILVTKRKPSGDFDLDEDDFTFGSMFRFLIIAAIIIALVLLIGGQVMQINKGLDAE